MSIGMGLLTLPGSGDTGELQPPGSLERAGRRAWSVLGILGVLAVVGWALVQISTVVIPVLVAILIAAALWPFVRRLRNLGVPDSLTAGLVLLVAVGAFVGLVTSVVSLVVPQLGALGTSLRDGADQVQRLLASGLFGLPAIDIPNTASLTSSLSGATVTGSLLGAASTAGHLATQVLVGLVVTFFYLKDGDRLTATAILLAPVRWQEDLRVVLGRIWAVLSAYVHGQLAIAAVDGLLIGVGLAVLGVPLAAPLGAVVALFALFPVVGAIVGSGLAMLVALANGGIGLVVAVLVLALVVFQLEAHVLSPLMLGRRLTLHPLSVVLSLTVGGLLFGIVGALLAVPVAASASQVLIHLRTRSTGAADLLAE